MRLTRAPVPDADGTVLFEVARGAELAQIRASWGFAVGVPADADQSFGIEACNFVSRLIRANRLKVHRLLAQALEMYRKSGENEWVGHIPAAEVRSLRQSDGGGLRFEIAVEAITVQLTISSLFEAQHPWTIKGSKQLPYETLELLWASAHHAALEYVLNHQDEATALGFDTTELSRQVAALSNAPTHFEASPQTTATILGPSAPTDTGAVIFPVQSEAHCFEVHFTPSRRYSSPQTPSLEAFVAGQKVVEQYVGDHSQEVHASLLAAARLRKTAGKQPLLGRQRALSPLPTVSLIEEGEGVAVFEVSLSPQVPRDYSARDLTATVFLHRDGTLLCTTHAGPPGEDLAASAVLQSLDDQMLRQLGLERDVLELLWS